MPEVRAAGLDALMLATELLQRARCVDAHAGLWEAADIQWWWRTPRLSDDADKLFWIDDDGPVAGVLLTSWTEENWQCDPVVIAGTSDPTPALVWKGAMEHAASYAPNGFGVPLSDENRTFREFAERDGLAPAGGDSTAWMDAADRPAVPALPEGFVITDRTHRLSAPHPLRHRSGEGVEHRLDELPLYDPELDIAVETAGGTSLAIRCIGSTRRRRSDSSSPSAWRTSSSGGVLPARCCASASIASLLGAPSG